MKLLIVGQAAQATGIARMTRCIAKGQSLFHETHVLGIDLNKGPLVDGPINGFEIHSNPSSHEVFAETRLTSLLDEIRPEVVLLYCDPWFIARYAKPINQAKHQCLTVGYIPIDGQIMQPGIIAEFRLLDKIVLFTDFGRRVVIDCAKQLGMEDCEPFKSCAIIPHGIAHSIFYPRFGSLYDYRKRRLEARMHLFPDEPALWEGYWVLNANRNQPRKRIDLTLLGFARFAEDKPPNVRLYLHMETQGTGLEILKIARSLGISDRLILARNKGEHPGVSSEKLNVIYNACDVGVNTSQGEGWGLISCEHAATGAPQIVPDHSACAEIWEGVAELLPISRITHANGVLKGGEISGDDLADALEKLYGNTKYYEALLEKGYQRTTDNAYTWDRISDQWNSLFTNLAIRTKDNLI